MAGWTQFKHSVRTRALDTLYASYRQLYARLAKAPVDENKVLFVEYRLAQPSDNFRQIIHALRKDRPWLQLHFHSLRRGEESDAAFIRRCRGLLRDMATAKIVFLCDANEIVSCVDKRPETKVIQLWHACGAFKRFGLSTIGNKYGPDGEGMLAHPYYRNVDLVSVSSEEVRAHYIEAMGLQEHPEVVKALGVSRTDLFFRSSYAQWAREALLRLAPQAAGRKVILYAPTFRGKPSDAKAPDALDLTQLYDALGEKVLLLIKHHPFVAQRPSIPADLEGRFAVDVSDGLPIEALLTVSDLCITDYSSLVFEYSLFEKPMVFFAYDLEDYCDWRGFYYPYEEMTPGLVVTDRDTLTETLAGWLGGAQLYPAERIRQFRERFMCSCDGHATERILREVFGA